MYFREKPYNVYIQVYSPKESDGIMYKRPFQSFTAAFIMALTVAPLFAFAQELEEDPAFPPSSQQTPSQTQIQRDESGKFIIKGSIQTLEAAIDAEKGSVDWYGWYLEAREHITKRGGLACQAGTLLTFRRNGQVQAKTLDPKCLLSIEKIHFPLPETTALDAVVLPVRSGALPPAPPSEIYQRTEGFK